MKKVLVTFVLGFAIAGGLFAALSYHFVLTDKELVVERKGKLGFAETFVDARGWGLMDYLKNPSVAAILAKHGIKGLAESSGSQADKAKDALEKLRKGMEETAEKIKGKPR
ncbi:MAG: hypothetical protein HY901_27995 [Deltaproteobacteria bacterium]|nr:hypothetical protein [Deltaproteobacteria bacterium]